jgi:hypothetical protein
MQAAVSFGHGGKRHYRYMTHALLKFGNFQSVQAGRFSQMVVNQTDVDAALVQFLFEFLNIGTRNDFGIWLKLRDQPMQSCPVELAVVQDENTQAHWRTNTFLDLSRFSAAPSARLSHLSFEGVRAFPAEC